MFFGVVIIFLSPCCILKISLLINISSKYGLCLSIVLDNINLNQKTLDEIKEIVENFNKWISLSPVDLHYDIKYQTFFDTPLEECIARDSKRENPIGENVIRNTYNKYKDVINENL